MATSELVPLNHADFEIAALSERARFAPVMKIEYALERRDIVKQAFSKLMKEGEDYGKVPGTGSKPTLLQPGAQKLDNLFGLVPRFPLSEMRIEEDWTGENHGGEPFFRYMVVCQLMRGEFVMGECIGECNSWESKYRYRKTDRACPACKAEAIIFTKKDSWWCAGFKGGCGKGFKKDDPAITGQEVGRKPNPEIFDQINTFLKMAQKRAHVGATINATSASEFFTQDLEDIRREAEETDTGGHAVGTQAAQDYVRDQLIEKGKQPEDPRLAQFLAQCADSQSTEVTLGMVCASLEGLSSAAHADRVWTSALNAHGDPAEKREAVKPVLEALLKALSHEEAKKNKGAAA